MHSRHSFQKATALLALIALATVFLSNSSVQATIMQRLEIEELARSSTDVFHGQILSTQTFWNSNRTRIYTEVNVRIQESFKGAARQGDSVRVVQLGGEKDGFKTDYAGRPEFAAGESVVLFATRTRNNELTVVGLKQGKMQVNGQTVIRDFSGITLMERSKPGQAPQLLKPISTQLTISELRQRIRSAK